MQRRLSDSISLEYFTGCTADKLVHLHLVSSSCEGGLVVGSSDVLGFSVIEVIAVVVLCSISVVGSVVLDTGANK